MNFKKNSPLECDIYFYTKELFTSSNPKGLLDEACEDRITPDSIDFFAKSPKSNSKFVVDSKGDLSKILSLVEKFNIKNTDVFLMPQGRTVASLKEKQLWIVDICKEYNFNYTDRLHIHIWGDKRRV